MNSISRSSSPRSLPELPGQHLIVVGAALNHSIELEVAAGGIKAGGAGVLDRRQHRRQGPLAGGGIGKASHAGYRDSGGAIEAEGDAVEAGGS